MTKKKSSSKLKHRKCLIRFKGHYPSLLHHLRKQRSIRARHRPICCPLPKLTPHSPTRRKFLIRFKGHYSSSLQHLRKQRSIRARPRPICCSRPKLTPHRPTRRKLLIRFKGHYPSSLHHLRKKICCRYPKHHRPYQLTFRQPCLLLYSQPAQKIQQLMTQLWNSKF